jgi:hypothetical protein
MPSHTSAVRAAPAALALLVLLSACDKPKDRSGVADAGGPLRSQAGAPAAPDGPSAAAPPALSAGLKPRPEFPGFYLDRINEARDPLNIPATLPADTPLEMTGFGFDGVAMAPAKGVDLDIDGRLFGTTYGAPRPDVATNKKVPALAATGYRAVTPAGALKPGLHHVVVRVVTADGTAYYQSPVITFTVR